MENNRIKILRKAHGMTQVELAEKLGVAQGTVQKLENDQIEFSTSWMRRIADVLEVEPYELLPLDMQPKETTPEEREMLRTFRKFTAPQNTNNANVSKAAQDEKHTPQPSQPPHKSNER
mgnify:CR=1 FL=1